MQTIEKFEPFGSKLFFFIFNLAKEIKKNRSMKRINIYYLWEPNLIRTFDVGDVDGKKKSFKKIRLKSILK